MGIIKQTPASYKSSQEDLINSHNQKKILFKHLVKSNSIKISHASPIKGEL